jgi:tRNA(Ile)-lysidine synthase
MKEDIYKKFLYTVKKNALLEAGDRVVAGLSGGADSVCLVLLLKELARREFGGNLFITAVHYNHCIRGEEANEDEAFCRDFCEKNGVELVVKRGDVPGFAEENKMSLEEAARKLRYDAFNEVADGFKCGKGKTVIAVAHNRNDRAETVFFNIARGSSVEGLKGISYKRENIVRPLLDISREETEAVCIDAGVVFRNDSTNFQNDYTRNKIRNKILPYISGELDIDVSESLLKLSELAAEENEYLRSVALKVFEASAECLENGCVKIDGKVLAGSDPVLGKRAVRTSLSKVLRGGEPVFKDSTGIDKKMTERIYEYILKNSAGGYIEAAKGVICTKSGNYHYLGDKELLLAESNPETEQPCVLTFEELKNGSAFTCPDVTMYRTSVFEVQGNDISDVLAKCKKDGNMSVAFDKDGFEKIQETVVLRTKRTGDGFRPFNGNGRKPLRRFFTDCKVPAGKRDDIPLLAAGSEVVHIFSLRRSDFASVHEGTGCAIIVKIEKLKE